MAEVPKTLVEEETRESQSNGDGDRQVLAPSEGPREDLINTAIKFLQNPKVMGSPLHQKKAFLSKKGLTVAEIDLAVERSGVKEMTAASGGVVDGQARPPPPGYQPGMVGPVVPAHNFPAYPPIPQRSMWARVRDLSMTTVVVVSVSYAVYYVYKTYIEPLIRGKSAHEKRLDRLEMQVEEIHKSVVDSLSEVSKTLAAIQISINSHNQQPPASHLVSKGITDLKSDISSLRSLLLSKNQFPPPPTTSPILPSWQLAGASSAGSGSVNQQSSLSSSLATSSTTTQSTTSSEDAMSASPGDTVIQEGQLVKSSTSDTDTSVTDQTGDQQSKKNESAKVDFVEDSQSS